MVRRVRKLKKKQKPKRLSKEDIELKQVKNIFIIDAEDYVKRSVARMFLERHRLAKKRKVDYVV